MGTMVHAEGADGMAFSNRLDFIERHGKEIPDDKPAGIKTCAAKLHIPLKIDADLLISQGARLLIVLLR
jgi:hypothetical protein